jgi:hypothetical protein
MREKERGILVEDGGERHFDSLQEYKNTNFIQPSDTITCTRNLN